MKRLFNFVIGVLLLGLAVLPAHAAFKSLYIFGDSLSATADPNAPGAPYFYGQRWSNGRVWVEVLAQRQGLTYNVTNNNSYWNHTSAQVVTDVKNFTVPQNVANDLFVVWVCNADTFDAATAGTPLTTTQWQATNLLSQANHLQIITNLYAKGVRTLIMPNAVDLSEIPAFNAGTLAPAIHAGCVNYNSQFSNTINQSRALCPGLTIYTPDFFTLLNKVLTNAAAYGLTNALSAKGFSIDAYSDPAIITLTLTNTGTNFIFWDPHDPTAEFHEVIADVVQQSISPVQISQLTVLTGSNRLDMVNVPVGLNGFVDGSTNLAPSSWTTVTNWGTTNLVTITSANTTQSIFFLAPPLLPIESLASGSGGSGGPPPPGGGTGTGAVSGTNLISATQFYRLRFPYAWTWP